MADRDSLLKSLLAAADTAQQVYIRAHTGNPGADLSELYCTEIDAQTLYFDALDKSFDNDPTAADVQQKLEGITDGIKSDLTTITDVNVWIGRAASLLEAATAVAGLFA